MLTDSYVPFLFGGAIATILGASLFLLLGRIPPAGKGDQAASSSASSA